jgi:hypothetical protein
MSRPLRRAGRLLFGILFVYALLVATHKGEFWPFSIYPMFSQAGNPFSRAVVRDVSAEAEPVRWTTASLDSLPGQPFPLRPNGVDNIDLANFVSKTEAWTPRRVQGLQSLFKPHLPDHELLVMRVNGRMVEGDSVVVDFVPYVYMHADSTDLNPDLRRKAVAQNAPNS